MGVLLRRAARVAATTAVVAGTANAVNRHQNQKYAAQDQAAAQAYAASQPAPVAAAPAAPAQSELSAQLEELNSLKNQGILTQEEFDAKKKQLLGI